jgi:predicted transcriptional regulator
VAATSLKFPDELKRRIESLAASARKTPHAFMVDALAREAERAELRERFAADAARAERDRDVAEGLQHGGTAQLARRPDTDGVRRTGRDDEGKERIVVNLGL